MTTYVHWFSTKYRFSRTSTNLPGVPMTISQPSLSLKPCSSRLNPPMTETTLMPSGFPNFTVSSSICCASSLVGARIIAYGPWSTSSMRSSFGSDIIQTRSGMRKAAVLPEPVSATPIMSL